MELAIGIISLLTALVGAILYFYRQKNSNDAKQEEQSKSDQSQDESATKKIVDHNEEINESIRKQKDASKDWGQNL